MGNVKKNVKYELGLKTKNVTIVPNWVLKCIGRFDAKKGEFVAMAHIARYLDKCASIENEECLAAEAFLKDARAGGAQELAEIEKNTKLIPNMPGAVEEHHDWDILENRRRASAVITAQMAIENGKARLYDINETLINGASILDERIARIRKKAVSKIDAYLKGLRAGGLTTFEPTIEFSDTATDLYYGRHLRLDEAIAAAAKVIILEEVK